MSASAPSVIYNALNLSNIILLECSFYDSIRLSIFGDALKADVFTSKTDNDKLKYFLIDATRKTTSKQSKAPETLRLENLLLNLTYMYSLDKQTMSFYVTK